MKIKVHIRLQNKIYVRRPHSDVTQIRCNRKQKAEPESLYVQSFIEFNAIHVTAFLFWRKVFFSPNLN